MLIGTVAAMFIAGAGAQDSNPADVVIRAEGTLSWEVRPQPQPDKKSVFVMFQVASSDGWNVGRNFRVAQW